MVHIRARKRERQDGKKKNHGQRYYALASKSGAIEQGGVKREDRSRQQLSLEAFFYVSFDPDISLFLFLAFHSFSFTPPFVFVVRTHKNAHVHFHIMLAL